MRRLILTLMLPLLLAACGAEPTAAPMPEVQRAAYRSGEPPSITLFTMISNRSNDGAHSGLMIDGSQRVMFDPAGSWFHRAAPEINDVHFGMTPQLEKFYIDYHARETYRVVIQKVYVTPETAELALRLVRASGAAPKAYCANRTSAVLRQLPGFASIPQTFFPNKIMRAMEKLPGVQTRTVFDDDGDDNTAVLTMQGAQGAQVPLN